MTVNDGEDRATSSGTAQAATEEMADRSLMNFDMPASGSALGRAWKLVPRAMAYLKPFRGRYAGFVVATGVGVIVTLAQPFPLAFVIDTVLKDRPPPAWITGIVGDGTGALILFAVIAMLALTLIGGGAKVLEEYLSTTVDLGMTLDFRSDLYTHVQRLSPAYHDDSLIGVLIYRINQLSSSIGDMVVSIPVFAQDVLTIAGMAYITYRIDPHVAELALVVVPLNYYLTVMYTNRIESRLWLVRGMLGMQLSIIHETLNMFRVIASFGREADQYARFRRQGEASVDVEVNITVRQMLFQLGVNFVTSVGTAAVLGVGAYEVVEGRMSAGELVVVMAYIATAYGLLDSLAVMLTTFQQQMISFQGSLRILDEPVEVTEKPDAIELGEIRGDVEFNKVGFDYATRPGVLKEVSFQVTGGQALAIVGPTGAGKSTLASLIPRFFDPQHGQVLIDGFDVRDLTLESLRKKFTIVLQEPLLFEGTIADNIRYGKPDATIEEVTAAAMAANAHDFITQLPAQYRTTVGEGGTKISGGERQRICVARAFLRNAPILILDEPTSSIDSRTEGVILDALDRLAKGRTTIMIAHRLSTIRNADQILVLDHGTVVQRGTHEQLAGQDGLYRQLFEAQNGHREAEGSESGVPNGPAGDT